MNLSFATVDRTKVSPMMQQVISEKEKRPDCLIFFRLGDFYELFFDDAVTVSHELELKLTGRDCGLAERAPMCGVPHHAADTYVSRLLNLGYKIAIVEQMEDPALAKGLVERKVIRVITPGTKLEPAAIDASSYSYLCAVLAENGSFGLACCDLASGRFETTEMIGPFADKILFDEIARFAPLEFVVNAEFAQNKDFSAYVKRHQITYTVLGNNAFSLEAARNYKIEFGEKSFLWPKASAALLYYLHDTQQDTLNHIDKIAPYLVNRYMQLDKNCRVNLELTSTIRENKRRGSLFWALDKTKTAMGRRMLKYLIEQPLLDIASINARLDCVEALFQNYLLRQNLGDRLRNLSDLERLSGKIATKQINPQDMLNIADTLTRIPALKEIFLQSGAAETFKVYLSLLDDLPELYHKIQNAIKEDAPPVISDGGIFKLGYNQRRDELESLAKNARAFIFALENQERERSGIKNLKIGYNKIFGYYIEVSKGQKDNVPDDYIRRQTLTNSERFVTPELKAKEEEILTSQEKLKSLELSLFQELREEIADQVNTFKNISYAVSMLDVFYSVAEVSVIQHYVRPELSDDNQIHIKNGRHPVVEQIIGSKAFVSNDLTMGADERRVMILTGPNMAGKSTYMRQVALIALMAQCGFFVPCEKASIGIVDKMFTRVGASDDVTGGLSTFMVEMTEVADILQQATSRSLLILDEIGRGTSTIDGLAIAQAVIEHLAAPEFVNARSLFATHFHELTALAKNSQIIFNAHVDVCDQDGKIIFLHKIKDGGTSDSYGVDVAQIAGVPNSVVQRARELVQIMEQSARKGQNFRHSATKNAMTSIPGQFSFLAANENVKLSKLLVDKIMSCNPNEMKPIEAYALLLELQEMADKYRRLQGKS